MTDNTHYVDSQRTACLYDVGQAEYSAVVAVAADGSEHLLLAFQAAIGDTNATYDPTCQAVSHEQTGPLPLDVVRRITIATRTPRCGRPTKAGTACRTPVSRPGTTCGWHRITTP
jgi:hypothetical protein